MHGDRAVGVGLAHAGQPDHRRRVRASAGNVHARDPTRAGGRRAELLQPPHERLDLLAVRRGPPVRDRRRHRRAPRDHRRRGAARAGDRVPAGAARPPLPRLEAASSASRTGIYTIPSLALFPLLVPFTGLSPTTVVIGLALYALTILVRSMLEGLRSVPDDVRESAVGPGVRRRPAAVPDRAAAGAAGDHGRPPGRHRLDGRADHGRLARRVRRPRQPDQGRRHTNFRAELFTASVLCVVLAVVLDVLLVLAQRLLTPWTEGSARHDRLRRHLGLPHRPPPTGPGTAACSSCWSSSCCSPSPRWRIAMLVGLPLALWLGHIGRGGFLAINISNVGRAVPTFALLALLVTADWPGTEPFGPYGRAGLATLIALALFALPPIITNAYVAVREVPADDQGGRPRHGHDRVASSSSGSSCRSRCRWSSPGVRLALVQVWATATIAALVAGPGLGPGDHRRLLPHQLRQGHRRRDRGRRGRAGARAARGAGAAGRPTRRADRHRIVSGECRRAALWLPRRPTSAA